MGIFDVFFGRGGRMQREGRGKYVVRQLSVTFEGPICTMVQQRKLAFKRMLFVTNMKAEVVRKGRDAGMQIKILQSGLGVVLQIQSSWMECQGHGECFSPKGRKGGQKTTLHGEEDQESGVNPIDIVIVRAAGPCCFDKKTFPCASTCNWLKRCHVVKNGDIKCALNQGMPTYHRPDEKSHLIIGL
ncbi:DnaJ subfamily A member 1, partial [Galemys pyrenaicus]